MKFILFIFLASNIFLFSATGFSQPGRGDQNPSPIPKNAPMVKETLKDITPSLTKIKNISNEIMNTENTYRNNLIELILLLDKAKGTAPKPSIFNIFAKDFGKETDKVIQGLKEILQYGLELNNTATQMAKFADQALNSKDLSELIKAAPNLQSVFSYFSSNNKFLKPYSTYTLLLSSYEKLLNDTFTDPRNTIKNQLNNLLIIPIQRGPRYELLFNELNKAFNGLVANTPTDDNNYTKLVSMTYLILAIKTEIKEKLNEINRLTGKK